LNDLGEPTGNVLFPIGYQKPETMGAALDIPPLSPSVYKQCQWNYRYGSTDGAQVPLNEGNLYAGENTIYFSLCT
jgi:hypothetical protein